MKHSEEDVCICRCEEIYKAEIQAAIDDGATTIAGIKKRTQAGMGLCQGRTCRRLITQMLSQVKPISEVNPSTTRPPVRTAKISEFIVEEDD